MHEINFSFATTDVFVENADKCGRFLTWRAGSKKLGQACWQMMVWMDNANYPWKQPKEGISAKTPFLALNVRFVCHTMSTISG
jgi:hypothetical protein